MRANNKPPLDPEEGDLLRKKTRDNAKALDRTRTRFKHKTELPEHAVRGSVVSAIGPAWIVSVEGAFWVGTVSGTVDCPHTSTIVAVGDVVWILPDEISTHASGPSENTQHTCTIIRVEERRTLLSRRAAGRQQKEQVLVANVDKLAIVMSAAQPTYNKRLIDRYLIAADKGDLEPLLIINKFDLVPEPERKEFIEEFAAYWDDLNIDVFVISAYTNENIDALKEAVSGFSTLLTGPSGVGKSSIINILTDASLRVGEISNYYLKGRHTTTGSVAVPLPNGGFIVDSPGIREFGIWELDKEELQYYFEEFAPFATKCKFHGCTHTHEPGCEVKEALERGEIDPERYLSYVMLFEGIDVEDTRR